MLAALLSAYVGPAAGQAVVNFSGQYLIAEPGHKYDGYRFEVDCSWLDSDVDAVKNAVFDVDCKVVETPPAGKAMKLITTFLRADVSFGHTDSLLRVVLKADRKQRSVVHEISHAMQKRGWHLDVDSTAVTPVTITEADTNGATLIFNGDAPPISSRGDPAVPASQECLIYDFVENQVHQK